jgi:hypothetical protein
VASAHAAHFEVTMRLRPALLALVLALAVAPASPAQPPPAPKQPAACELEMWSCIAGCIDGKCLERCAAPCKGALTGLRTCLRKARCAPGDSACWRSACPEACGRVFAAVERGAPGGSPPAHCTPRAPSAESLPEDWVGRWELSAASFVRTSHERDDQFVRADYGLRLRIVAPGCFELETRLGAPTLGEGNSLTLRIWGDVVVHSEQEWEARATGGALTGELCGKVHDVALPNEVGRSIARVSCTVDQGDLVLSRIGASERHLFFDRVEE